MCIWIVGEGSSNRNASRDESVEADDESAETRDESIEAREKTQQSCYNNTHTSDIISRRRIFASTNNSKL